MAQKLNTFLSLLPETRGFAAQAPTVKSETNDSFHGLVQSLIKTWDRSHARADKLRVEIRDHTFDSEAKTVALWRGWMALSDDLREAGEEVAKMISVSTSEQGIVKDLHGSIHRHMLDDLIELQAEFLVVSVGSRAWLNNSDGEKRKKVFEWLSSQAAACGDAQLSMPEPSSSRLDPGIKGDNPAFPDIKATRQENVHRNSHFEM